MGGEAIFVKTDVSKARDVKVMIEQTLTTFGRLDFAFNNAGIEQLLTPLPDKPKKPTIKSWTSTSKAFGCRSSTRFRRC